MQGQMASGRHPRASRATAVGGAEDRKRDGRKFLLLLLDARRVLKQAESAIEPRQWRGLTEIVILAGSASPYCAEHYRRLPNNVDDKAMLPVTIKKVSVARFDDRTDREITREAVRSLVEKRGLIGAPSPGEYA